MIVCEIKCEEITGTNSTVPITIADQGTFAFPVAEVIGQGGKAYKKLNTITPLRRADIQITLTAVSGKGKRTYSGIYNMQPLDSGGLIFLWFNVSSEYAVGLCD